jgi:hypothetical protein
MIRATYDIVYHEENRMRAKGASLRPFFNGGGHAQETQETMSVSGLLSLDR